MSLLPGPTARGGRKVNGQDLRNRTLIVGRTEDDSSEILWIENAGCASAGATNVFLYVNYEVAGRFLSFGWEPTGFGGG